MNEAEKWFEKKHFIEDISLLLEENGIPRMAGRIIGWLLISDPPHQSIDDLAGTLQASKGSISTMTRLLLQIGVVERVGLPGQRRDYFRIKMGSWSPLLREQLGHISSLRQVADRGLTLVTDQPAQLQARLKEVRDLYAFFEEEFPALLERWQQERKS